MSPPTGLEYTANLERDTKEKNQQVLDYVHGRLGEKTSQGQCILHLGPGGEIRRVEWRSTERAEDIVE